jgi:hypothetical protein
MEIRKVMSSDSRAPRRPARRIRAHLIPPRGATLPAEPCPRCRARLARALRADWKRLSPDERRERTRAAREARAAWWANLSPQERAAVNARRSATLRARRKRADPRR